MKQFTRQALLFIFLFLFGMSTLKAEDSLSEKSDSWNIDLAFQQYILPSESDLSVPVISLSNKDLLIESRYNYEGNHTGSLWLGHTFSFGESWEFELTPMLGGVFGSLHGMAPGMKADVSWQRLNLYSELEYVFSFDTREDNFFYSWSELTVGLWDWLRIGVVGNRTRAYDSAVDIDRGPIVRFEFESLSLSCTVLNIDDNPLVILGAELSFGA